MIFDFFYHWTISHLQGFFAHVLNFPIHNPGIFVALFLNFLIIGQLPGLVGLLILCHFFWIFCLLENFPFLGSFSACIFEFLSGQFTISQTLNPGSQDFCRTFLNFYAQGIAFHFPFPSIFPIDFWLFCQLDNLPLPEIFSASFLNFYA